MDKRGLVMVQDNDSYLEGQKNMVPNLEGLRTYEKVKEACEYLLEKEGYKKQSGQTLSSTDLFNKVTKEFHKDLGEIAKNTFSQYLSNTVRDTESRINCLGIRRGYYLLELEDNAENTGDFDTKNQEREAESESIRSPRRQRELLLYPVLESWLIAQGYQAEDVSSGRSLGKWGNPDVAGISALDAFNGLSVEVVTIEAKTSLLNWEQSIFEAISHRRFANRSYFAFAHSSEMVSKIPQDIRYYAELYNIGVLTLSIEDKKFESLTRGEEDSPLDPDDVDIIELYSAPYNFVQPRYQLKFCDALGITCIKELYQWGNIPQ